MQNVTVLVAVWSPDLIISERIFTLFLELTVISVLVLLLFWLDCTYSYHMMHLKTLNGIKLTAAAVAF